MFCPSCGVAVQSGQKFCTSCGVAIPTAEAKAAAADGSDVTPTPPLGNPLPPPPATEVLASAPITPPATEQFSATTTMPIVEQTAPVASPGAVGWNPAGDWTATVDAQAISTVHPFRITPLVVAASLAGVLAVASAFVDVAGIEISDIPATPATEQLFKLNDFATNHTIGTIIAALALIAGSAMAATGRRIGAGLAGGAGLALAGMLGMVMGSVTQLFDATQFSLLSSGNPFTLTTTRDIGFWLALVAALLGGAVFVLSFEASGPDGRRPISPLVAALGLLGTAMAVIGPLIPQNGAEFADQFSNDFQPPATLMLRQLVLILIAVGGIVGFTRHRRWGLGMAAGAICIGAFQLLTALTESGDIPLSYAGGNLGAVDFAPHVVTVVGVAAMVAAVLIGLIVAAQPDRTP